MREILFKGKREDNGEWVYGHYWTNGFDNHFIRIIRDNDGACLIDFEVIPETVGQYTGLTDKDGKKIFEGDIISVHQFLFDGSEYEDFTEGEIAYCIETCAFSLKLVRGQAIKSHMGYDSQEVSMPLLPLCEFYGLHEESYSVIGNIHDNPELLASANA